MASAELSRSVEKHTRSTLWSWSGDSGLASGYAYRGTGAQPHACINPCGACCCAHWGRSPPSRITSYQRRACHEALLDADSFEDLLGKW
jgi:hypothetical protein